VHLTLTLPGGVVEDLGAFPPGGQDMGFSTTLRVPVDTPPGKATVRDDKEHPATFVFQVGG
jgi:hypothetical protein